MKFLNVLLVSMVFISACKTIKTENKTAPENNSAGIALPSVFVYKTKADYSHNVPVILSEDKKTIVSFPDPSDLMVNGEFRTPVKLSEGYLLDRKGISKNVAFLRFTYDEYSKLTKIPSTEELKYLILENDPLLELWDCGKLSFNSETELISYLNKIISNKEIKTTWNRLK